jgi:hypothetical protein
MRNALLLSMVLMLSGCSAFKQPVPIQPTFPNAVPDLMKKCEELKTVTGEKVLITDLLKTVVENYTMYYECSNKVEGWQEWYNEQKRIYENVK